MEPVPNDPTRMPRFGSTLKSAAIRSIEITRLEPAEPLLAMSGSAAVVDEIRVDQNPS